MEEQIHNLKFKINLLLMTTAFIVGVAITVPAMDIMAKNSSCEERLDTGKYQNVTYEFRACK